MSANIQVLSTQWHCCSSFSSSCWLVGLVFFFVLLPSPYKHVAMFNCTPSSVVSNRILPLSGTCKERKSMCVIHCPVSIWQISMSVLQRATTALSMRPASTSRAAFAACPWSVPRITASQETRKYLLCPGQTHFWWQDLLNAMPLLTEHRAVSSRYVWCWQGYPVFCTHKSGFFLMLLFLRKRYSLKKCHVPVVCTIMIPRAISRYSLWLPCRQPDWRATFGFEILGFHFRITHSLSLLSHFS